MKLSKKKYTFAFKYLMFQLLFNPFGLLFLYILPSLIIQKTITTELFKMGQETEETEIQQIQEPQIKEIQEPQIKEIQEPQIKELPEDKEKEIIRKTITTELLEIGQETEIQQIQEVQIKELPEDKEKEIRQTTPQITNEETKEESLDYETKAEIERIAKNHQEMQEIIKNHQEALQIVKDRLFKEEIEMEEMRLAEQQLNYSNTNTNAAIIVNPYIAPLPSNAELWDMNPNTIGNILYEYAFAREQANYQSDISILMVFVQDNLPNGVLDTTTMGEAQQNINKYLLLFNDISKILPDNIRNETDYQFKFYKVSVLTYFHCFANNTLQNSEQVQLVFDDYLYQVFNEDIH